MLIRVMYHDFRYDFVKPFHLDKLLETGRISMFRRRNGWVFVGIDPVRELRRNRPRTERRQSWRDRPQ